MKIALLSLLIFFFNSIVVAQNVDGQIEEKAKEIKVIALSYPDSAELLLKELKEKYHNPSTYSQANILKLEGVIFIYTRKLEGAIEKFRQAYGSYESIVSKMKKRGDTISLEYFSALKGQAQSINNVGSVSHYTGDHMEAIHSYLKAISLHEQLSNSPLQEIRNQALENMATTTDNIGRVYRVFGQLEKALDYSIKAYKILDKLQTRSLAGNMLNMAYLYNALEKTDSALFYAKKVQSSSDPVSSAFEYYAACKVIAEIYVKYEEYDEALRLAQKIERYKERNPRDRTFHRLMIDILLKQKKYDEAEKRSLKMLSLFSELKMPQAVLTAYELLYEIYRERSIANSDFSDAEKFMSYFAKYHELEDSIQSQEKYKEFNELQTKYETEQKDKANLILESQLKEQKIWVLSLSIGGALLIILFIISYRFYLERKKAAQRLTADKEIISKQASKLRALDAFKSRFFANVSHDLRTPLTLIQGHIFQVREDENYLTNKSQKSLLKLENNTARLIQLTDEIRDLILLEDDKLKLNYDKVKISKYLKRIVDLFSSAAALKKINLEFRSNVEKELSVHLDPFQFEKMIYNLMSNALKFTSENGNILVSLNKSDEHIIIIVKDDGTGISKDEAEHIFERYYQADKNVNYAKEGLGIGLALVLELVELHGGNIQAKSEPGRGTSFEIKLPFNLDKELAPSQVDVNYISKNRNLLLVDEVGAAKRSFVDVNENQKRSQYAQTILIVDDHPDIRNYLKELIEDQFIIRQAGNGMEALDILNKEKIDIVITDIMMPLIDGHGLIQEMKGNENLKNIPVFVISARTTKEDKIKALEQGVNDFLAKPFVPNELKLKIKNALIKSESGSSIWESVAQEKNKLNDIEKNVLTKINTLILSRIDDSSLSVQDIADELIYSRRSTYNIVKELSGMNPKDYIKHIKFQYVQDLMKKKKVKSLTEAAHAIGMSNATDFGKQFQKKMGVSPSELIEH